MKRKSKRILQVMLFLAICILCPQNVKATTLQGATNAEKVFRYFNQNGYSKQAAAAIVGNIMNEGGGRRLNFSIHTTEETNEARDKGIGMCQWTFDRKTNFIQFCRSQGVEWYNSSLEIQVMFLERELNGVYGKMWSFPTSKYSNSLKKYNITLSQFKTLTNTDLAVGAFCCCFERPSERYMRLNNRQTDTKTVYDLYVGPAPEPIDLVQDGSYPTPITCVPAITSGRISVYDQNGNVEANRWIDANDQCTIRAVYTNGLCAIEYPSGSGTRSAYVKKSDFITNTVTPYTWSPSVQLESYRRSNLQGGSYGKVFTTDKCTVVGKNGDIWQLIYPITGGYKLGWVNTAKAIPSQPSVPPSNIIPSPKFVDFVGNKQIVVMIPDKIAFSSSAYISAGDICIINTGNVGQGQCAVRYPSGGNNVFNNYKTIKDATINVDQAISYNPDFAYQKATAQTKYTVYPTAAMTQSVGGNSTNWSLDPGDEYYTINRSGDATEVLYYCNTGAHKGYWKIGWAYIPYYMLDLNGTLDQNSLGNLEGYGCADVYVNGNQLGQNVTDFYQSFPCGSTYEIKNIQTYNGYTYTGIQNGSLSGTITGDTEVRLAFIKNAAVCTGINIASKPSKVEYLEGEAWNASGLSVTASYSDGTTEDITGSCQVTGYDSTPGVKTITISYSGFETAFSVNVRRKELDRLELVSAPKKTTYNIGEMLDYEGLQLKAYYNNGTSENVVNYESYADEYVTQKEGTKTIELSYSYYGSIKYVTFKITVVNQYKNAPTLKINPMSVKKGQKFNVDFNLTNNPGIASLKVKVNYDTTLLKLVQVKYNSKWGGNSQQLQILKSPFILNWFNGAENFKGDDVFATAKFEVIATQEETVDTTFDITYDNEDIFNINEENVGLKLDIGSITINNQMGGKVLLEMSNDFSYVQGTIDGFDGNCSYGLLYKRGRVSDLTLETSGRIRVAFTKLAEDHTFIYDMSELMGYTYRAYVIYTDENGDKKVEYSEPVVG